MSEEKKLNLTNNEIDFILYCVRFCRGKTNGLVEKEKVEMLDNVSIKLSKYLNSQGYYSSNEEDKILKETDKFKSSISQVQKGSIADIFGITSQTIKPSKELDIHRIKNLAKNLYDYIESIEDCNILEMGTALFKLKECVMWAVKGISS